MRVSDERIDRIYCNSLTRNADYEMKESHSHYYYELFYIKQGTCHFFINNRIYRLSPGDYLIIPPHEVHYNQYLSQCTRYNIYFYRSHLIEDGFVSSEDIDRRLTLGVWHAPSAHRSSVESVFDSMLLEESVNDSMTGELLRLKLNQLFLYSMRYCIRKEDVRDEELISIRDNDYAIEDAAKYIASHFNQSITLEQLAKKAGLSPTYFSKKFRKTTGMGMKEYIIYVRLQNAALELKSTRHSITDVALNCGFNDSNYFKDAFKKMYGMPPREYRKSYATDLLLKASIEDKPTNI